MKLWDCGKAAVAAGSLMLLLSGCAARVGYGYNLYDPYYGDYHYWAEPEPLYYNQWFIENHRPYRDFHKLHSDERRQYFNWRHSPGARPSHGPAGSPAPRERSGPAQGPPHR
ncbi:MAG TPA: hypothetical protein VHB50_23775 [Bryobacteraceae bacterium]|nr:hypothetical protein [Bryobacteraceae bacterium]